MIKILFNNDEVFRDVEFTRKGHIITLRGIVEQNTSGFTTWRMDGITQLGDFSAFTTVYRVLDEAVQYSDDGSVWVEPSESIDPPKPTPTQLDIIEAQVTYTAMMTDTLLEG